jgi:ABC-type transporter Mla MlaB component
MNQVQLSVNQTILQVTGDITFDGVVKLRQAGESLILESKQSNLQCDFGKVQHCESVGLSLMAAWQRFANRHNKKISWINIPSNLERLAKVCGMQFLLGNLHG